MCKHTYKCAATVQTHTHLSKLPLSQTHQSGKGEKLGSKQEGSGRSKPGETGRRCHVFWDPATKAQSWSSRHARLCFPKEAGGDKLPRRSWSAFLSAQRQCTQGFPYFKSKMLFWSSSLERNAQILPNYKHFKFPCYFSSKHFMAICGLNFTLLQHGRWGLLLFRDRRNKTWGITFLGQTDEPRQSRAHTNPWHLCSFIPTYLLLLISWDVDGSIMALKNSDCSLTRAWKVFTQCWMHHQAFVQTTVIKWLLLASREDLCVMPHSKHGAHTPMELPLHSGIGRCSSCVTPAKSHRPAKPHAASSQHTHHLLSVVIQQETVPAT